MFLFFFLKKKKNTTKTPTELMYIFSFKCSIIYSTSKVYVNMYMYFILPEQAW